MNIIVGYLPRPESEAALEMATEEAALRDATLHVVQLINATQAATSENPQRIATWSRALHLARARGEELGTRLRERGVDTYVHVELCTEEPGQELLRRAHEMDADLLVIGIRRRSRVGKLVLGSVAQHVLLGSDAPVLAVKAPRATT